jgi:hypothetical protein
MGKYRFRHPLVNHKACTKCLADKFITDFDFVPTIGLYRQHCRECLRTYARERGRKKYGHGPKKILDRNRSYRERNKIKFRNFDLKRYFGITFEEFEKMLTDQGGRCKLCGTAEPKGKHKRFHVDHYHPDGSPASKRRKGIKFAAENRAAIRGILCGTCNVGIGMLKDSPALLRHAADYIEKFKPKVIA